jgi:hypothetical protein
MPEAQADPIVVHYLIQFGGNDMENSLQIQGGTYRPVDLVYQL